MEYGYFLELHNFYNHLEGPCRILTQVLKDLTVMLEGSDPVAILLLHRILQESCKSHKDPMELF